MAVPLFFFFKSFFTFLTLAIFREVFAHEPGHEVYNLDELKNLKDEANRKIWETSAVLNETPTRYGEIITERFECLQWECVIQKENMNKSTGTTVIKGLLKKKKLIGFQCISNGSSETLDKLNASCSSLSQDSNTIVNYAVDAVMQYKLLVPGFEKYVQDTYQKAREDMKKADKEEVIKNILLQFEKNMNLLTAVLSQINAEIERFKNKFFESYVKFVYDTETALRKIVIDGTQKIQKCII